ncbi:hypothetical protein MKX07_000986 [Trichoderma sp. CBMAI-0711]|nr:hypothetical protein MKX07_000986 [Trichoderma sp. CBMAI-0711]
MVPELLQPPRDILVRLVLADVVDEEGADCTSVVCGSNGAITLLTGRVPNLRLDRLGVDLDRSGGELDTDGGLGVEVEFVTGESAEKIGLSDSRVSNQDNYQGGQVSNTAPPGRSDANAATRTQERAAPLKRN